MGCVPCSSQEVGGNWGAEAFVSAQIQDRHGAVGLSLSDGIGRVTVVHPLIFLPQRVDLETQRTSLYDYTRHASHSKLTTFFSVPSFQVGSQTHYVAEDDPELLIFWFSLSEC